MEAKSAGVLDAPMYKCVYRSWGRKSVGVDSATRHFNSKSEERGSQTIGSQVMSSFIYLFLLLDRGEGVDSKASSQHRYLNIERKSAGWVDASWAWKKDPPQLYYPDQRRPPLLRMSIYPRPFWFVVVLKSKEMGKSQCRLTTYRYIHFDLYLSLLLFNAIRDSIAVRICRHCPMP